jgi:Metallo-beta-lactamase superfamily
MADKLLVRAYNVEVGDCLYCRIPKARKVGNQIDDFHMLIDCGTVGTTSNLPAAITNLKTLLPNDGSGKKRLDLLVATHKHADHIAGFDPALFQDIAIGAIWMNAAMDPEHPQAELTNQLHGLATTAMRNLASLNLSMSPDLQDLVALYSLENDDAMTALSKTLPTANDITPLYVHAGKTPSQLGLPLHDATIRVIGPENDIDHFYLGEDVDETLHGLIASGAMFRESMKPSTARPANISESDFRRLRSRMMSTALAFAELSGEVTNNTSVVLLIEWKNKRLLFVGDAEWNSKFKDGKHNASWNVMWHERKSRLNAPIDFLKIGHHGSVNATPWNDQEDGEVTEPSTILDAILPIPAGASATAKAVVSTMRKNYQTIPRSALLVELGKRVANVRNYQTLLGANASSLPKFNEFEKTWLGSPQPMRTDCENALSGAAFVDVEIEA